MGARIQLAEHQSFETPHGTPRILLGLPQKHLMHHYQCPGIKQCSMHPGMPPYISRSYPAHILRSQERKPVTIVSIQVFVPKCQCRLTSHLHQGLWVIPGPLFEMATVWKLAQSWEWGYNSNPVSTSKSDIHWQIDSGAMWLIYCQSMSSRMAFPLCSPCVIVRYSHIHFTRWSLNMPLMTWCNRSGKIIS